MDKTININLDDFKSQAQKMFDNNKDERKFLLSPHQMMREIERLSVRVFSLELFTEFLTIEKHDDTPVQPFQSLQDNKKEELCFRANNLIVDFFYDTYKSVEHLPDIYNASDKEQICQLLGMNCMEFFSYEFVRKYTKRFLFKSMSAHRAREDRQTSKEQKHPAQDISYKDNTLFWRENQIVLDLLKDKNWRVSKYNQEDIFQASMLCGERIINF